MMIYPTSPDVGECAEALCDQHIHDQLTVVGTLLAGALHARGIEGSSFGECASKNHPLVRWAAMSWDNFLWLSFYGLALADECDIRFNTLPTAVSKVICAGQIGLLISDIQRAEGPRPDGWFRSEDAGRFPNLDVFDAHRCVLLDAYDEMATKGDPPTWTGVNPPHWFETTRAR
jgi:hypothetical protein